MSIFSISKEQSQANVDAAFKNVKESIRSVERKLTDAIYAAVVHSIAHNCPNVPANLIKMLDDEGMTKQMRAAKSFFIKYTAVSLKGDTPKLDEKRKEALATEAKRAEVEEALNLLAEQGLLGWYAEQTGDKSKSEKTEAEKRTAKEKRVKKMLEELGEGDLITRQLAQTYALVIQIKEKNEGQALDMIQAINLKLMKGLNGTLDNLKDDSEQAQASNG